MPKTWHLSLEEAEAALATASIPYRVSLSRFRRLSGTVVDRGTQGERGDRA